MNRAPYILLGAFTAIALSWTGIILSNQLSYGKMKLSIDADGNAFPKPITGQAARGKYVYQDLGCIYCHTQQVRRPGFGSDSERGWGERQSVARDYIREQRVLLGTMRTGPDLRNVGQRLRDQGGREWHIKHFYDVQLTSPGSIMPNFRFLFETRKIIGEPSSKAIQNILPAKYQPAPGHEIVLTERGESLIEYLLSLKDPELYPDEALRIVTEKKEEPKKTEAHK